MTKLKLLILIFSFFVIFPSPLAVLAIGQVTEPINITNALRGGEYQSELIVVNTENKQVTVQFSAEGQIADWTKFYLPTDLKNTIATTTTIAADTNLNVYAVFSVPQDTPNGEYKGLVSVIRLPDAAASQDQSYATIAQKIDREVTIKVSDQEVINLNVSVIPKTYDLKTGEALSVRFIYDNQSNISLSPSIEFKIKKDDKTIYNVIYPYPENEPAVRPNAQHEIPTIEIPTNNWVNGKYLAELKFLRGDKVILEKQFSFSLGSIEAVSASKLTDFFKNNLIWLLWLIVLILMAAIVALFAKNWKIKKGLKNIKKSVKIIKKRFGKASKLVRNGIASWF